jgi:hypothetical protein
VERELRAAVASMKRECGAALEVNGSLRASVAAALKEGWREMGGARGEVGGVGGLCVASGRSDVENAAAEEGGEGGERRMSSEQALYAGMCRMRLECEAALSAAVSLESSLLTAAARAHGGGGGGGVSARGEGLVVGVRGEGEGEGERGRGGEGGGGVGEAMAEELARLREVAGKQEGKIGALEGDVVALLNKCAMLQKRVAALVPALLLDSAADKKKEAAEKLLVTNWFDECHGMLTRALALQESRTGEQSPEMAVVLINLGDVMRVAGKHADAERLFERAVAVREESLGPAHPDTAKARKWLKKGARAAESSVPPAGEGGGGGGGEGEGVR